MDALSSTASVNLGTSPPRRLAIIGGGVSGLAAAHRVHELEPTASITLFEASDRLGGVLQTERGGGWLIERSADMFTTREPWVVDLCQRIGIGDELIETDARYRRAFVVRGGRLAPVPQGFMLMAPAKIWPIVTTPIFSPAAKLRLACEYFVPRRQGAADESLESFAVRRFGREAFERLIQPLIGGIYTADPSKLSMAATLPQFVEMEQRLGSVTRGLWVKDSAVKEQKDTSGVRYGQFVAARDGMQRLVDAIAAKLPPACIRLGSVVEQIEFCRERSPPRSADAPDRAISDARSGAEAVVYSPNWNVMVQGMAHGFDDLIVATPGVVSSRLLANVDSTLAALIGHIPHAGCTVAIVGVRQEHIAHPLDGFGFVVPAIENRRILACSFASRKFAGRAPQECALLRVFLGGALQPELNGLSDDAVQQIVRDELKELIGLSGEPDFWKIARWRGMMPQYQVGHSDLVRQIDERAAAIPHFALAGNAYHGVGIPFCVRSGEQAAERLIAAARQVQRAGYSS